MSRPVTPDVLERALARVAGAVDDPKAGLFGPASMLWRVDREAALFLGAGRALLLQLAHPFVAAGVAEHSRTLSDPIGRFHRTFAVMYALVFGNLDQALEAARRLHRRHAAVTGALPEAAGPYPAGTAYLANEAQALLWVHATLADTALVAHDLVLPPLAAGEQERYYAECRRLGALFGLPPEDQPEDLEAFRAYFEGMLSPAGPLQVSAAARAVAGPVLAGAGTWLRPPRWYRDLTAGLLPEPLRDGFGLRYGPAERRRAERAVAWLARLYPALPARLRQVGPAQEARGRLDGQPRPDALTRTLNRFWIGRDRIQPERRP
jgi:uncharacterized protein (DUF2236 family)